MIIGNGLLANIFVKYKNNENIVIFAAGVSNSNLLSDSEYKREEKLLMNILHTINNNQQIIYFSTTSIYDKSLIKNKYQQHKLKMETLIKKYSKNYLIFRLSNVIGKKGNRYNLINFFYENICKEKEFKVWKKAERNIVDIDHVYEIVSYIIDNQVYTNEVINVASQNSYKIVDIVKTIEKVCNKKAKINLIDKESIYDIDINLIKDIIKKLNIKELDLYSLIKKYKGLV